MFVDECHLVWNDICGYIWGKTDIRIEVPMKNEKQRPTYYGALNSQTGRVIMKAYPQGNTANTIKFIDSLKVEYSNTKLVIIWDGVADHNRQEFREYQHRR